MIRALRAIGLACMSTTVFAQIPDNLVVEGIPPIPIALKRDASRYLEFRTAAFASWHPTRRDMLIGTRFSDTLQLHAVAQPGGARRQLTFSTEPVAGGQFEPRQGRFIVFSQDVGGGEFYQLHRLDLAEGKTTLLTDGRSRNATPTSPRTAAGSSTIRPAATAATPMSGVWTLSDLNRLR